MSWIEKLYETYRLQPESVIGKIEEDHPQGAPLLPICHTTNKAQIEIVLDSQGNFCGAKGIDEVTIIPCTEESSGRTSGPAPHPLCDKLQYIAADYSKYCDEKACRFDLYAGLLGRWVSAGEPHPKVAAVQRYIEKRKVIADLIEAKILFIGADGKLLDKWDEDEPVPAIFKAQSGAKIPPSESFIRWRVELSDSLDDRTWADRSLWESWIHYYMSTKTEQGICFVTGEAAPLATQHPAKIRNAGDKAKLISSNDGSGFTYRGRFTEADQVAGLSFEVTQKAHNALRWLIGRQGSYDDGFAVVAWAVSDNVRVPNPIMDTFGCYQALVDAESVEPERTLFTGQDLALRLNTLAAGYSAKLRSSTGFVVMGIDSATTGRMAIRFYRELEGSEYLSRIASWHESCAWPQNFGKDRQFVGAPAPRDIAEACYGRRLDDKLRKATIERMLPCIVDGAPIPRDIVESATRHAANRASFENAWEWEKVLGIACALYRKFNESRGYAMALEKERNSRDYLYGRLLAVADVLEGRALWKAGESRPTTAARLMQRFSDHPCSTWKTIELSLAPYKARLGGQADWFNRIIDDIKERFVIAEFVSDKALGGEFLLGYHCQRAELYKNKEVKDRNDDSSSSGSEVKN
jgi:CRISPR-associated protein Cas8c/Csd1, subtype I-C/DVULG